MTWRGCCHDHGTDRHRAAHDRARRTSSVEVALDGAGTVVDRHRARVSRSHAGGAREARADRPRAPVRGRSATSTTTTPSRTAPWRSARRSTRRSASGAASRASATPTRRSTRRCARAVVDLSGRPGASIYAGVACASASAQSPPRTSPTSSRSLAVTARCTLHVDVLRGENDHHKAEAAFKALRSRCARPCASTGRDGRPEHEGSAVDERGDRAASCATGVANTGVGRPRRSRGCGVADRADRRRRRRRAGRAASCCPASAPSGPAWSGCRGRARRAAAHADRTRRARRSRSASACSCCARAQRGERRASRVSGS